MAGINEPGAAARLLAAMPFAELIGVEILNADAEAVEGRMTWDESRCTAGGVLHGGALMALADSCGGLCAYLNLPEPTFGTATLESKTNLLRAVRDGHVIAAARPLHRGAMTIVIETEVVDDRGRLVSKTTQTQAVLPPREGGGSSPPSAPRGS